MISNVVCILLFWHIVYILLSVCIVCVLFTLSAVCSLVTFCSLNRHYDSIPPIFWILNICVRCRSRRYLSVCISIQHLQTNGYIQYSREQKLYTIYKSNTPNYNLIIGHLVNQNGYSCEQSIRSDDTCKIVFIKGLSNCFRFREHLTQIYF